MQGVALLALQPYPQNPTNRPDIRHLCPSPPLARWVQFPVCPPARGKDRSATLTTLFENAAVPTVPPIDAPVARKKHGWLPLLTVLFLISYGLMTMLIVEQGSTIESQRALIRELYRDSAELTSQRMKAQQEKSVADAQHQGQTPSAKTQAPVTQYPSSQYPSTQAPTKQSPSSQAAPQHRTQLEKTKPQIEAPSRPVSDRVDDPRSLITL